MAVAGATATCNFEVQKIYNEDYYFIENLGKIPILSFLINFCKMITDAMALIIEKLRIGDIMIRRYFFYNIIIVFLVLQLAGCQMREEELISCDETYQNKEQIETSDSVKNNNLIYVYITGCVKNPGVYQIKKDERLIRVVELAGGFTSKASEECVNLASKLEDGTHIRILSKKQYKKSSEGAACEGKSKTSDLININTASEEELCSLAGIGENKASSIVEYRRSKGLFKSIEDIKNVSGIGDAVFDKIKEYIIV